MNYPGNFVSEVLMIKFELIFFAKIYKNILYFNVCEIYRINEVQTFHNETQTMLQEVKHALKDVVTRSINNVEDRITEAKEETKESVTALR